MPGRLIAAVFLLLVLSITAPAARSGAVVLHDFGGSSMLSPWGLIELPEEVARNLRKETLTPQRLAELDGLIRSAVSGPPEKRREGLQKAWLMLQNSRPEIYGIWDESIQRLRTFGGWESYQEVWALHLGELYMEWTDLSAGQRDAFFEEIDLAWRFFAESGEKAAEKAYIHLGNLYLERGLAEPEASKKKSLFTEAFAAYQAGIVPLAKSGEGQLARREAPMRDVLPQLEAVENIFQSDPDYYVSRALARIWGRGFSYYSPGSYSPALADLDKARKLDPGYGLALCLHTLLRLDQKYGDYIEDADAEELEAVAANLLKAARLSPVTAPLLDLASANIWKRLNGELFTGTNPKIVRALAAVEEALAQNQPGNAPAWRRLSQTKAWLALDADYMKDLEALTRESLAAYKKAGEVPENANWNFFANLSTALALSFSGLPEGAESSEFIEAFKGICLQVFPGKSADYALFSGLYSAAYHGAQNGYPLDRVNYLRAKCLETYLGMDKSVLDKTGYSIMADTASRLAGSLADSGGEDPKFILHTYMLAAQGYEKTIEFESLSSWKIKPLMNLGEARTGAMKLMQGDERENMRKSAYEAYRQAVKLDLERTDGHMGDPLICLGRAELDEAVEKRASSGKGGFAKSLEAAYADLKKGWGLHEARCPCGFGSASLARLEALRGNNAEAVRWLELYARGNGQNKPQWSGLENDADFAPLRGNKRFQELVKELG